MYTEQKCLDRMLEIETSIINTFVVVTCNLPRSVKAMFQEKNQLYYLFFSNTSFVYLYLSLIILTYTLKNSK